MPPGARQGTVAVAGPPTARNRRIWAAEMGPASRCPGERGVGGEYLALAGSISRGRERWGLCGAQIGGNESIYSLTSDRWVIFCNFIISQPLKAGSEGL